MLETERLALRRLEPERDAAFILELVNEPSFLQYIGDRGVRTLEDAQRYVAKGPVASYAAHGFGLNRMELKETGEPIGICGLLKRETLEHPDLGFALRPRWWRRGYAREAAAAVLDQGRDRFGLLRVLAITSLENPPSIALLGQLGFRFEGIRTLNPGGKVRVFARDF